MATWNVVSRTYIAQVQKTAGRANLIMGLNEVGI